MNKSKYIRKISVFFCFFGFAFSCMVFGKFSANGKINPLMSITTLLSACIFAVLLHIIIALDTVESLKNN